MRAAPSGLLPTPGPQPPSGNLGPLLGNATTGSGQSLVTFDPAGDDTRLLTDPSIEYLNTGALRAAREAWFTCLANASMYRQRAEMMMGDDPNLAVLAETQSRKQVSKISCASEKDATGALKTVAKTNVEALERFERTLGAPPPGGCGRPSVPRTNSYWRASTTPPAATGPASPPKASSTTCSRTARRPPPNGTPPERSSSSTSRSEPPPSPPPSPPSTPSWWPSRSEGPTRPASWPTPSAPPPTPRWRLRRRRPAPARRRTRRTHNWSSG